MLKGPVRFARALPVLSVVVLAGCGVAGTDFHPGVAAQVGEETLTTRHVDEVTADYCTAIEKVSRGQAQTQSQRTPNRYLSRQFATTLIEKAAAEQLAADYGVSPSPDQAAELAQLEPQLADLDEDEKDAVREVVGAGLYTDDVLTQLGALALEEGGTEGATEEDELAAGRELLQEWVADNDVEVNPRYAIALGADEPVDTDLSFATSELAEGGLSPEADATYAEALPDHLVCLE